MVHVACLGIAILIENLHQRRQLILALATKGLRYDLYQMSLLPIFITGFEIVQ